MTYKSIVISSGHGKIVRGASGVLDEVNEARRVVEQLADELRTRKVIVNTFHDDTSKSQNENLNVIVEYHNSCDRDLDISVHFNAYEKVSKPMGTECLYLSQSALAANVSKAIASCGLIDRGAKKRTDLFFLNYTDAPAILIEVCFVDSTADAQIYAEQFENICEAIANALSGAEDMIPTRPSHYIVNLQGKVSWFGGPTDEGVKPDEGLAFIYDVEDAPFLFLPEQPANTTGLARRLNPNVPYIATRWDYNTTPREMLLSETALVHAPKTGITMRAFPADWGPHVDTGRVADISSGLLQGLGLETDDEVVVLFPYKGGRRTTKDVIV